MNNLRQPAVAGRFYPADAARLEQDVAGYLALGEQLENGPAPALALLAPHAGYMYSGAIAGQTYATVRVPSRVIVICPNHTGLGVRRSMWANGAWRMPGGDIAVDHELAAVLERHTELVADELAHLREHAIEVQLPFLRARAKDRTVRVVPVCLARLSYAECHAMGLGIARALRETRRQSADDVLIVASTDMSHYVPAETARRLDDLALERIRALDAEGLYHTVVDHEISMCGYVPTTVSLVAACALGARRAELVRYGNSGAVTGDMDHVVGYAGVVLS